MRRRTFLGALSGGTAALSGCAALRSITGTETTPTPPTFEWSEEPLSDGYRVTVMVQLNSAEKVLISKTGGNTLRTITESGTYTIAGPSTTHGPATLMASFEAEKPHDDLEMMQLLSSHTTGSQKTTQATDLPFYLSGLNGSTDPDLNNSDTITTGFMQETLPGEGPMILEIPTSLKSYYESRLRVPNFGIYTSDSYDDPYLQAFVNEFEKAIDQYEDGESFVIPHLTFFVQNLEYTSDQVGTGFDEYPKFPIETLADKEGDCEDTCILLAELIDHFNYAAALLLFPDNQHMAVGLGGEEGLSGTSYEFEGHQYYYVETTAPGWNLGEVPPDIRGETPEVVPIDATPVIVFSFDVVVDEGGVSVEITLKNVGDAGGQTTPEVLFENRTEQVVAAAQGRSTHLGPEEQATVTVNPDPPTDQSLRAKVRVEVDGSPHDMLTSEYQDPIDVDSSS